jgi:hypothetical protein
VTVGDVAVEQNDPEAGPENVALAVFEVTVPPFIVAVATTESDAEHPEGAVIVNVAVPEASVIAVPFWPASGPVIVKVTVVPTTGTPFDKTTAVLVMVVEPEEPHTIEEFTGESTTVGPLDDPEHPLIMVSLPLIVTAPLLASARPLKMPPSSVMLVNAIIFPAKVLPVCMVAEEPTCQKTLQGDAPLAKATVAPVAVISVLPILKIHTSVELPVSVRVPVSSADDEKQ